MQIAWTIRFFTSFARRRGGVRFASLLDKTYSFYYRARKQSAVTLLKTKAMSQSHIICIVCKGNVCRSPFLTEYLKSMNSRKNKATFISAGLRTKNGSTSPKTILLNAAKLGVDLSLHTATEISADMVEKADLIVGMEPIQHLEFLLRYFKWRKKFLLLRAIEKAPKSLIVPDPFFLDAAGIRESFELLMKDGRILLNSLDELETYHTP